MSRRAKKPPKRGPGRPPLNPEGGTTAPLTLRLSDDQILALDRLVADGRGANRSDALRRLVDDSSPR